MFRKEAKCVLHVPDRVPFAGTHVFAYIDDKCKDEIDEDGRAEAQEGDIDKKHPDLGRGNAHPLAQEGQYTEHPQFTKLLEFIYYYHFQYEYNDTLRES